MIGNSRAPHGDADQTLTFGHHRWLAIANTSLTIRRWGSTLIRIIERSATVWASLVVASMVWPVLFASPKISSHVETESTSVIAGRPYQVELRLVNESPRASVRIDLASNDQSVRFEPRTVDLGPGGRSSVSVHGLAGTVGAQTLPVRMSSVSGWFHASQAGAVDVPLTVWPPERFGRFVIVARQPGWVAFRSTLDVGLAAPKGFECQASVDPADNVDFTGAAPAVSFQKGALSETSQNRIEWSMAALDAFGSRDVYVFLKPRERGSPPDWNALANRITWTCARN